jgi:hypothetical protein
MRIRSACPFVVRDLVPGKLEWVSTMRHFVSFLSLGLLIITGCPTPQEAEQQTETEEGADDSETDDGEGETAGHLPASPTLEIEFSPIKQFVFSWTPTYETDFYRLLERVDGSDDHRQVGDDIYGESLTLTVPLHFRSSASYVLQACNPTGCTDSEPVDVIGTLADAVGYFKPSNTGGDDMFGWSVALSADGSTLAVAALGEDSNAVGIGGEGSDDSAHDAGAVYVYRRSAETGGWTQDAYVKPFNTNANDYFGWRVALSADGDTLAVSAIWEDAGTTGVGGNPLDNSAPDAGAVYVFEFDPFEGWAQQAYIKPSNTGEGDNFGTSLALSLEGNTLAVGAPGEDSQAIGIDGDQADESALGSGAVYVFQRDDMDAWTQQAYIKASNTDLGDDFGRDVALSGNGDRLAVGASWEDSSAIGIGGDESDDSVHDAGAVYVFARDGLASWTQEAYVKPSNTGIEDFFGTRLALSADGTTLVVGAHGEDSSAVGIDGDQADDSAEDAGAVYVFRHDATGWAQQAYIKASNTSAGDSFGSDIALSTAGDILAIGAAREDANAVGVGGDGANEGATDAGAAYVLHWDPMSGWRQRAYVKASNAGADDRFGDDVMLSGDGEILVVGASWEDGAATGISGNQADDMAANAGAVYMY